MFTKDYKKDMDIKGRVNAGNETNGALNTNTRSEVIKFRKVVYYYGTYYKEQ